MLTASTWKTSTESIVKWRNVKGPEQREYFRWRHSRTPDFRCEVGLFGAHSGLPYIHVPVMNGKLGGSDPTHPVLPVRVTVGGIYGQRFSIWAARKGKARV